MPTFFVVTYLVAWAFFFAGGMTPAAWPRGLLFLLGTFAPGYVALWLTSRESGRGGVTALLRRLVDWQVPARWYAFAIGYMAVVKLTVALVHRVTTGAWPQFGQLNRLVVLQGNLNDLSDGHRFADAAPIDESVDAGRLPDECGCRWAAERKAKAYGVTANDPGTLRC